MKKNFWELLVESYENDMKRLEEVYSLESAEDIGQMPICNDENAAMPYETPKANCTVDGYIPIEWIEKWFSQFYGEQGLEWNKCKRFMLEDWERENEQLAD